MEYKGITRLMWKAFEGSFTRALQSVLNYDEAKAKDTAAKAEKKYVEIVKGLPEFEKGDSFKVNILSCAMFCAYCLNMEKLPDLDTLTLYYEKAMMNPLMKVYCRIQGLNKFSWRGYFAVEKMARAEYGSRNPYSWNLDFIPYDDGSGYEARFYTCGICKLMKEMGLEKQIPAMCQLDYTMAKAGGVSDFVRRYTLASGGKYCDNGYRKKNFRKRLH